MEQSISPVDNIVPLSSSDTITNFERWRYYLSGLSSPQSYVDFSFHFLISAALQRRVWLPPTHKPCYPNLYIILVGDPGLGKGLVIAPLLEALKYHRIIPPSERKFLEPQTKKETELAEAAYDANYRLAKEEEDGYGMVINGKKQESFDRPLLIPVAADATTYEALIRSMSRALRRKDYVEFSKELQKNIPKIYTHSSLCFCLEEISSLFRSKSHDTAKLLLNAYDCGDYEYDTKTAGRDRIRKCCLNFFGGTTPGFMQDVFNDKLLTDGFASRTFFIYETKNRDTGFFIKPLNDLQQQYRKHIIEHVRKLTELYGEITLGEGVEAFLEDWWERNKHNRLNSSLKMESYYSRKKVHIMKMAMALHFGECLDMTIPVSAFQRAIDVLASIEKNMHYALAFDSKNPLFTCIKKVQKYLAGCPDFKAHWKKLFVEIYPDLPRGKIDYEEVVQYLITFNKIEKVEIPNEEMRTTEIYYRLILTDTTGKIE